MLRRYAHQPSGPRACQKGAIEVIDPVTSGHSTIVSQHNPETLKRSLEPQLATEAGEPVRMPHLLAAARREYDKLERALTEPEIRGWA